MNILILSCGTRNKIVRYFRNDLNGNGRVICADRSRMAPALYEADSYHIVPGMEDDGYLEQVLDLCRWEKACGVL